jgi:DNA processing protein
LGLSYVVRSLSQALRELSWAASSRLGYELEAGFQMDLACEYEGMRLISVHCQEYPVALKRLDQRPAGLYLRGQFLAEDERAVAVVGTRSPSRYGLERARRLALLLARERVTVVSGLARGIDTAAHSACLAAGGRTVAVLGCGLLHCYPPENAGLLGQVSVAVSQFDPDFRPRRWAFPARNRLIAGLAGVSVAVECGPESGTMSELNWALRLGRRVALPESLVLSQAWARQWADQGKAVVLRNEAEILSLVGEIPAVGDSG